MKNGIGLSVCVGNCLLYWKDNTSISAYVTHKKAGDIWIVKLARHHWGGSYVELPVYHSDGAPFVYSDIDTLQQPLCDALVKYGLNIDEQCGAWRVVCDVFGLMQSGRLCAKNIVANLYDVLV